MAETALTNKRVLGIAIPIVLSNATVPILGAVDTGVVGQLGEAAPIGAVGIGAVILSALYWIFGFLRMGTTGLAAQALGAGDRAESAALLSRALLIAATAGSALILLQIPLFWGAFKLAPASAEVETLALSYMQIRICSAPAAIAIYGITGWLVAQERTRGILLIQLVMNGTNILLDLVFVLGFGWGVEGVAIATLIAEYGGLAIGLWLCRGVFAGTDWRSRARVFDVARLRQMAVVNSAILIRSVLLQAIFVSFLFWGSDFGDVQLAANQILLQFLFITSYAQDGFAFAAEALVGQALGARKRAALRRAAKLSLLWGFGTCIGLSFVFAVFGPFITDVMATSPDVRAASRVYLIYMVLAPLVGCLAWMMDGIFIGATRSRDMRNMMIISATFYFVTIVPLMNTFENHGLWIGLLLSFAVRGITLTWRYPALEAQADS